MRKWKKSIYFLAAVLTLLVIFGVFSGCKKEDTYEIKLYDENWKLVYPKENIKNVFQYTYDGKVKLFNAIAYCNGEEISRFDVSKFDLDNLKSYNGAIDLLIDNSDGYGLKYKLSDGIVPKETGTYIVDYTFNGYYNGKHIDSVNMGFDKQISIVIDKENILYDNNHYNNINFLKNKIEKFKFTPDKNSIYTFSTSGADDKIDLKQTDENGTEITNFAETLTGNDKKISVNMKAEQNYYFTLSYTDKEKYGNFNVNCRMTPEILNTGEHKISGDFGADTITVFEIKPTKNCVNKVYIVENSKFNLKIQNINNDKEIFSGTNFEIPLKSGNTYYIYVNNIFHTDETEFNLNLIEQPSVNMNTFIECSVFINDSIYVCINNVPYDGNYSIINNNKNVNAIFYNTSNILQKGQSLFIKLDVADTSQKIEESCQFKVEFTPEEINFNEDKNICKNIYRFIPKSAGAFEFASEGRISIIGYDLSELYNGNDLQVYLSDTQNGYYIINENLKPLRITVDCKNIEKINVELTETINQFGSVCFSFLSKFSGVYTINYTGTEINIYNYNFKKIDSDVNSVDLNAALYYFVINSNDTAAIKLSFWADELTFGQEYTLLGEKIYKYKINLSDNKECNFELFGSNILNTDTDITIYNYNLDIITSSGIAEFAQLKINLIKNDTYFIFVTVMGNRRVGFKGTYSGSEIIQDYKIPLDNGEINFIIAPQSSVLLSFNKFSNKSDYILFLHTGIQTTDFSLKMQNDNYTFLAEKKENNIYCYKINLPDKSENIIYLECGNLSDKTASFGITILKNWSEVGFICIDENGNEIT